MRFVGALLLVVSALPLSAQYSARRNGDIVELEDAKHQTVVSVIPSLGDIVVEMKVKGQNVLHIPATSAEAFKEHPVFSGVPFLAPWANRLDEQGFYANGKKYNFNMTLGNVRGAIPMHGFLTMAPSWEVVELKADKRSAWLKSRLEFYRHPDWMEQFPFAHTIEITQRLEDGVLEVDTKIDNLSVDSMPVAVGFHPYFQLTDSKREDWTISVGARTQWLLAPNKIPTGETEPIEKFFPDPKAVALRNYNLDHVFGDLIRDPSGRASFSIQGKQQRLEVQFGPTYKAAVIYSPDPTKAPPPQPNRPAQDPNFICFEPMSGITDAMNLAQKGLYKELQSIPPGGTWQGSFWIKPSGF
ncbi:MAG TPA: aldose 1-epimerase [Granulicella sp.]